MSIVQSGYKLIIRITWNKKKMWTWFEVKAGVSAGIKLVVVAMLLENNVNEC